MAQFLVVMDAVHGGVPDVTAVGYQHGLPL